MPNQNITVRNATAINPRPAQNIQNMGREILNPPPPLVRKLMELQAELRQAFPNNPNVLVAFNGQGGCLIGMEQQAMNDLVNIPVQNMGNPVLDAHTRTALPHLPYGMGRQIPRNIPR